MDRTQIASTLQDRIPLDKSPIGLAFVDQQPSEVSRIGKAVPSSCAFWREAESGVFYASAEDHYNCTLGAMVMGFELTDRQPVPRPYQIDRSTTLPLVRSTTLTVISAKAGIQ